MNQVAKKTFETTKKCQGPCKRTLTRDHFHKNASRADGLREDCKECHNKAVLIAKRGSTETARAEIKADAVSKVQTAIIKDDAPTGFTVTTLQLMEHAIRFLDGPDKLAEKLVEQITQTDVGSLQRQKALETMMRLVFKANEQTEAPTYATMTESQLEGILGRKMGEFFGRMSPEQQARLSVLRKDGTTG